MIWILLYLVFAVLLALGLCQAAARADDALAKYMGEQR